MMPKELTTEEAIIADKKIRSFIEDRIIHAIRAERRHQEEKWGIQEHSDKAWLSILVEEVGELAKAINETQINGRLEDYPHTELEYSNIIEELIQVAAVSVAHLEDILYYLEERKDAVH